VTRGLSNLFRRQTLLTTPMDAPKALNIAFNVLGAVESLGGDLAGWLLFHERFLANDRLVGD
jgi:hypothetical protein